MYKILNNREKALFYATLGVIMLSAAYNCVFYPTFIKNRNLSKEITLTRAKLNKYLRLLSQKEYIQKRYADISAPGADLGADASVNALAEIEKIAKDSDVLLIDLRPQTAKTPVSQKEFLIDLRTEGTMEGYLKFIYNIENSLSLLKINTFQINVKPNSQALEGNFSITQLSTD